MTHKTLTQVSNNSAAVAFHKFTLLITKNTSNDLFCFYEGKDTHYYTLRIKNIFRGNYHIVKCGNKINVIKTFELVEKNTNLRKYKKAFFIDLDFDLPYSNPDIYETPTYSIENFYVYDDCMIDILKSEFFLNEIDNEFKEALNLFLKNRDDYNKKIQLFNSWYACIKEKKQKENLESTNVSLDNKLPKNFLRLEIDNIVSNYTIADIKKAYIKAIEVTDEEILEKHNKLAQKDLYKSLRGKFQLTFLLNFLEYLVNDSKSTKKYIKNNSTFNTNKSNILSHLTQYAHTPDCLKKYINSFN